MTRYLSVAIVLALAAATGGSVHADNQISPPSAGWEPADTWELSLEMYPRQQPAEGPSRPDGPKSATYRLRVLVTGEDQVGPVSCWRLAFLPEANSGAQLPEQYYLSVGKEHSWPQRLLCLWNLKPVPAGVLASSAVGVGDSPVALSGLLHSAPLHAGYSRPADLTSWLERYGDAAMLADSPPGFPIELFPCSGSRQLRSEHSNRVWALQHQTQGNKVIMEAILKVDDEEQLRIRQHWVQGEKWWREYERHIKGRKDLHARRLDAAVVQAGSNPSQQPVHSDDFPLRRDHRLQVRVTIQGMNPELPDILTRLQSATQLSLTVADELSNHHPELGSVQLGNMPAWSIMEWLTERQLEQGRWEKTKDGYRLLGNSTARRAAATGGTPFLFYTALVLGGVLLLLGAVLVYRIPRASSEHS